MYGGFSGDPSEDAVADRSLSRNETILTGDLGVLGDASDNSVTVVTGPGATGTRAELNGFTVRDGNADGVPFSTDNFEHGAGIAATYGTDFGIVNCHITANSSGNLDPVNKSAGRGAGMNISGSIDNDPNVAIVACRFTENILKERGSGTALATSFQLDDEATPVIVRNCLFAENEAVIGTEPFSHEVNGTIYAGGNVAMEHCTITNNTWSGGTDRLDDATMGVFAPEADPVTDRTIIGSIVWANDAEGTSAQIYADSQGGATVAVTYSDVEEAWPGMGNIQQDPLFTSDYRLGEDSPCIDGGGGVGADGFDVDDDGITAECTPDLDRGERVWASAIDMGAYEVAECPADLDVDRRVGFNDLLMVLSGWCGGDAPVDCADSLFFPEADIDNDGMIGFSDLLIVLSEWGSCNSCEPGADVPQSVTDCMSRTSNPGKLSACIQAVLMTQ